MDGHIANARAFFTDGLSLRVFDACVNRHGVHVQHLAFPGTLEIVCLPDEDRRRLARLAEELRDPHREKFIYGAGASCKHVLEHGSMCALIGVSRWSGIIDNNVAGERYGLPIVSFAEFALKHRGALVLNSIGLPVGAATHRQCLDAEMDCLSMFELLPFQNQYFDLPKEMGLVGDGEVFVHAGCFNGDTQKNYVNWFGDTYAKMVTFEPNLGQYAISRDALRGMRDIEIVQAGLSDRSGTVRFDPRTPGSSSISKDGSEEIDVVALDEHMRGERVTFLALDVEGEELAVLRGAKGIIGEQKPKLAISAYHRPGDIWEIPFLVKEYNPGYRLYLRHYHLLDMTDTVLYAV